MEPYTIKELRAKVQDLEEMAFGSPAVMEVWGLRAGDRFEFQEGNATNGIGWRLFATHGRTINARVGSATYLGASKQEAMLSLMALQREIYLIDSLSGR
jgi:hypothetical protein